MAKPLVSVVLITWNRRNDLEAALDSVFRQTIAAQLEVIVIDNDSSDGTVEWLRNDYRKPVKLYAFEKNQGASGGRNAGIKLATAPYICFLDSDAEIESEEAIEECVRYLQSQERIRAVTASIWLDQDHTKVFAKGAYLLETGHFHGHRTRTDTTDPHFISTCFAVWEKTLLEELRGFDPWYFWGIEDVDLGARAYHRAKRGEVTGSTRFHVLEHCHVLHEMSRDGRHRQHDDFTPIFHSQERQRLYMVLSYGGIGEFFRVLISSPFRLEEIERDGWEQRLSWKKRFAMLGLYPALRLLKFPINLLHLRKNFLEEAVLPEKIEVFYED